MNCPVCKTRTLVTHSLTPTLASWKCDNCGGQWINSFQFWKWIDEGGPQSRTTGTTDNAALLSATETKGAKICPECGRILAKYKVGHELDFSLDRCGNCGGIWFDRNEWEILQSRDLQKEIHLIFSDSWQHRVRDEECTRHLQELLIQKIGQNDFAEIKRIKEWLKTHPHRQELFGFLNS